MTHFLFSLTLLFLALSYLLQTHIEVLAFFVASMVFAAATFISVGIERLEKAVGAIWFLEQASRGIDMTAKEKFYGPSVADLLDDADTLDEYKRKKLYRRLGKVLSKPAHPLRKPERSKPK